MGKSHVAISRRIWVAVAAVAVLLTSCSQRNDIAAPAAGDVSARDIAALAAGADMIADARLEQVSVASRADGMDGALVWTIERCHIGTCKAGNRVTTPYAMPFSTSGLFCSYAAGCIDRPSLEAYVGERFLITLSKDAYEEQVSALSGTPQVGASSLNRGFYLIEAGRLYSNNQHRAIYASYTEVLEQL
ncbi:hypothetical protein MNO14_06715 [Luteimonas sp. S4-F44]|uniref:hypothetical protein n=1 Tax=Luteimonas sp. S4-F44 TaxID=2925842 RepID=UPI001F536305|nr:hypothetical protein [Luteimonas sp. S4-F44]UNK43746.1 hypothetical protein MNO14_06715 [Luteimonas sp. S4-F44]